MKTPEELASLLYPYCQKEQIESFVKRLYLKPVTSILRNPYVPSSENLFSQLEQDTLDSLLYRYDKEDYELGKSVNHFSGSFYILDPSSALISYYLAPLLNDHPIVLDMCAAPGGKSIALSFRKKDSLILSNDISYTRAIEIEKNSVRLGLSNILSLSIDPMKLDLPPLFDCIILDAPCSGSGMIRKEKKMLDDYSQEKVKRLLPIQENLLSKAYTLLKENGILAYSTCSLSIEEDENQIDSILSEHPDLEEIKVEVPSSIIKGKHGYHMIPGIYDGEGIYFCLLIKKGKDFYLPQEIKYDRKSEIEYYHLFSYKKNEYYVPRFYKEFSKLPFISPGLKKFDLSDHPKCEFDHAYCKIATSIPTIDIIEEDAIRYIKGDELILDNSTPNGLVTLSYDGARLGLGKKVGNRIKNYLPKGLRTGLLPLKKNK